MNAPLKKFLGRFNNDTIASMIVDIQDQRKKDDNQENFKLLGELWSYLEKRESGITGIDAYGKTVRRIKDVRTRLESN